MKDNRRSPSDNDVSEGLDNETSVNASNLSQTPDSLNVVNLNTFESSNEVEWLLEYAIPSGYYTSLYGEGGMGKSYIADYLGILACLGEQSFCGLKFPERRINTLLIDYELNPVQQQKRFTKICTGLGLSEIPENFTYSQPTKGINILLPEITDYLVSSEIGLIIIDSLGAAGVDPLDVNKFIRFANQLRQLEITSLIIDHQAKQQHKGRYGDKAAYGTVYKRNFARSDLQIFGRATSENVLPIEIAHKKSNFGKKLDLLKVNIVFGKSTITFEEQSIINPNEQDLVLVGNAIRNLLDEGQEPNQTDIVAKLIGVVSKHRIVDLLNMGTGSLWNVERGERNSKIYELIEPEE